MVAGRKGRKAAAKGIVLRKISSCVGEACIVKGEMLSMRIWLIESRSTLWAACQEGTTRDGMYVWLQNGGKEIYFPNIVKKVSTH